MNPNHLDFEQPIVELEAKIRELRNVGSNADMNLEEEIARLEQKCHERTQAIFSELSDWQVSQLARHPDRPYTLDYLPMVFDRFEELHGDRLYADDHAIVGGPAMIDGRAVMLIGHQKGRGTREKVYRNFGMPRPEGYRKARRLMEMAARFKMPVVTFIDTPGAYPGVGAEERGQSEAIARNLAVMSRLPVPIVCFVIGEGGSGGALAIGVGDRISMLQYSIYSVISPEGCASILWKSADKAAQAAGAMGLTATKLKANRLIDKIIQEPAGGAHRSAHEVAVRIRETITAQLDQLEKLDADALLDKRYQRLMSMSALSEA